ncbi:MAG: hypothetical protein KDC53_04265 [Saprospiraceae bacterium]|nr:hypothetical protein [Saprospiraceae bacterium]
MSFINQRTALLIRYAFIASLILSTTKVLFSQKNAAAITYKNGLKITIPDSSNQIKTKIIFNGRIHYDVSFIHQSEQLSEVLGSAHNGQEFRRIFIANTGSLFYGNLNYKVQLNFSGGKIGFRDIYIEPKLFQTKSLEAYLRAGQFKDPFRFENLLSSNNLSIIERSYLQSFAPLRNTGLMYHMNALNNRFAFQLAYLGNTDDTANEISDTDGFNITTRATYLITAKKENTIHVGISYSLRNRGKDGTYTFKVKPPVHLMPNYISVSLNNLDDVQLFNVETAWIRQRLMVMAEMITAKMSPSIDKNYYSFYGQVSYFLNRNSYHEYNNSLLGIKDIIGKKGAIEIAGRYSLANFGADVAGKSTMVQDFTLGGNFYFNEQFRLMLDYTVANLNTIGTSSGLNLRMQLTF